MLILRLSGSTALNPQFPSAFLDGVFVAQVDGPAVFQSLTAGGPDILAVVRQTELAILRLLESTRLIDPN